MLWKIIAPYVLPVVAFFGVMGAYTLKVRSNTLKSVRARQDRETIKARKRIDAEKIDTDADAARRRLLERNE